MTDHPPTPGDDRNRVGQDLEPAPLAVEAHQILQSATTLTLTEANKLGIRRLLDATAKHPVTITERGEPLGHLYSAKQWDTVYAATAELTSFSLHALAEILTRLKPEELMSVVEPVLEILEFGKRADQ